jgi:hypothetical protein
VGLGSMGLLHFQKLVGSGGFLGFNGVAAATFAKTHWVYEDLGFNRVATFRT